MLSAFPFLTAAEFSSACQALADRVHAYGSLQPLGWSSVRVLQQVRELGPALSLAPFHAGKINRQLRESGSIYLLTIGPSSY